MGVGKDPEFIDQDIRDRDSGGGSDGNDDGGGDARRAEPASAGSSRTRTAGGAPTLRCRSDALRVTICSSRSSIE